MSFRQSMTVKKMNNSMAVWLPYDWGVQKGDLLHVETTIGGHNYIFTARARQNSSTYLILPRWWDCAVGDILDLKITYANDPMKDRTAEE